MATLNSAYDWTGREVNGVILGDPVYDPETETYKWDHQSIPADWIDQNGDIWLEVAEDAQSIP